ncbi:hypothetical protein SHXM_04098 [Streptomyces hygroscopicus]|nr:hypothetical protein SHXM_04098 [Streptomyces hygroscopicus]
MSDTPGGAAEPPASARLAPTELASGARRVLRGGMAIGSRHISPRRARREREALLAARGGASGRIPPQDA